MAINVIANFNIPNKDYARGVKRFHFGSEAMTADGTGVSAITAFTSSSGSGSWFAIDNPDGFGDIAAAPSAGGGGLEYAVTGNIFQGGSDTATVTWAHNFVQSSDVPVVAEYRDGSYKYFGNVTHNGGAGITSGQQGGADHGIALQFGGFLAVNPPREVTVATDLAAITS